MVYMANKENMQQYNIRLPPELIEKVRDESYETELTFSAVVRKVLKDHYGLTRRDSKGSARQSGADAGGVVDDDLRAEAGHGEHGVYKSEDQDLQDAEP